MTKKTGKPKGRPKIEKAKPAPKASAPKPEPAKAPGPRTALIERLAKLNVKRPAEVLAWMSKNIGRKIAATKELTADEVTKLQKLADEVPAVGEMGGP